MPTTPDGIVYPDVNSTYPEANWWVAMANSISGKIASSEAGEQRALNAALRAEDAAALAESATDGIEGIRDETVQARNEAVEAVNNVQDALDQVNQSAQDAADAAQAAIDAANLVGAPAGAVMDAYLGSIDGDLSHLYVPAGLGDTFAARGSQTALNLYLDGTSGNDSNDGTTSGAPVRTLAKVDQIIRALNTDRLPTPVVVNMAGTITTGHTFRGLRSHIGGLTFRGEPLVDGEPVTHLTMGSGAQFGLRLEPGTTDVLFENLRITNFRAPGGNGYGILMKEAGSFRVENCRVDNCDIGISATESVSAFVGSTTVTNCTTGIQSVYSSSTTFGALAFPVTVTDCVRGFHVSRNAVSHIDYVTIEDCTTGVNVNMASRVHILGSDFKRNDVGVKVQGAAEWNNNPVTPNDFHYRTLDANGQDVVYNGVGRETRLTSQTGSNEWRSYVNTEPVSTSTGTNQSLNTIGNAFRIPAYLLDTPGRSLRVVVSGRFTGAATKTLQFRRTNTTASTNSVLTTLSTTATGAFIYEATVRATGPDAQQFSQELRVNGQPNLVSEGARSEFTGEDWLFRLYGNSGDVDSSITVSSLEVFLSA